MYLAHLETGDIIVIESELHTRGPLGGFWLQGRYLVETRGSFLDVAAQGPTEDTKLSDVVRFELNPAKVKFCTGLSKRAQAAYIARYGE